ncbi:uncharacterized protein BDR25DRAFT_243743 [Lindgomyces ingoldianus]|uniref:Uncharacterized protein n=1 Tax=Lindgomyces ingoldianus TaxID=673940 RepID=A0ACB6QAQ0_9PLEO|nr:uncharacterized protein BDR25DRAFT_243743 [Lindgomyces ingoldianus]KAF2464023.1 hypothetical protein BDR25DRAFT_243743 [Lindgomyces ingoldianus]
MENIPIPDGDTLVWRAYGELVKKSLVGSNVPTLGVDYIFVCPPTEFGIRGGSAIPDAVTNWNISKVADSLQRADSPLFVVGADGSYYTSLQAYLNAVKVKKITPEQEQEIDAAITRQAKLEDEATTMKEQAEAKWAKDKTAKKNKVSFQKWAVANAPSYLAKRKQVQQAAGQVRLLQSKYYGAVAATLQTQISKLEVLAGDDTQSNPGFNMPCYLPDYQIDPQALKNGLRVENLEASSLNYRPLYAIEGYEKACDDWIKGVSGADTTWTFNFQSVSHNDWTSLGHSTKISRQSNSFFFFFSKTSSTSTKTTNLDFGSTDWQKQTSITLRAKGPVQTFNVTAGLWDVPGVRKLYPTLLQGEKDTAHDSIKLNKICVGYQVSVTIKFAESLRNQVRSMYQSATSTSDSGLRILGFQFGAGEYGNTSVYRDMKDLKYNENSNEFTLPPSPEGCPVLLGLLGRKLGA